MITPMTMLHDLIGGPYDSRSHVFARTETANRRPHRTIAETTAR